MSIRDVKVCLLGDSGVGKSSLVMRFVLNQFKPALESTIGASFMTKNLLMDELTFKFQIWDTAGQEKYRSLAPMYYRGASAAIIVYDVTRESSFQAMKEWVRELRKHGPSQVVLAIAGNKSDLDDLREVRLKDAKEYSDDIGAIFAETSALTAHCVHELFSSIARSLPTDTRQPKNVQLTRRTKAPEPRRSCCGGSRAAADSSDNGSLPYS